MPVKFSYLHDAKFIRIPAEIKTRLDESKPPGIEAWKFAADMLVLGMAAYEQLKKNKDLQGLTGYKVAEELVSSVDRLMVAGAKK